MIDYLAFSEAIDAEKLLGIWDIKYRLEKGELHFKCINPDHNDSKPSCGMSQKTKQWSCWSCGAYGSVYDFVMILQNCEFPTAVRFLSQTFEAVELTEETMIRRVLDSRFNLDLPPPPQRVPLPDSFRLISTLDEGKPYREYLEGRGIDMFSICKFKVGYANTGVYSGCIIIPITRNGAQFAFMTRSITEKKYRYSDKFPIKNLLFNHECIKSDSNVILVEGVLDALRVHSIDRCDVVSSFTNKLFEPQANMLAKAGSITVMPDADDAGRSLALDLLKYNCHRNDLSIVQLPRGMDPSDCDDNTLLLSMTACENLIDWEVSNVFKRLSPSMENVDDVRRH